ncbi:MAG: hypothetical protein HY055_05300 [Magnetospirillum sp.]|nr:hypothetical protein [Magnetospirillum sp.]
MTTIRSRIACFIDGFNPYHALHSLKRPELKWLDLRKLLANFIDPSRHELTDIYYFLAYAERLPGPCSRHKEYVRALEGVRCHADHGTFQG